VNHSESCVVVDLHHKPQGIVEKRWIELVAGFRTALERMRPQPKYPPIPDEEAE
jgi:hypothetical protein